MSRYIDAEALEKRRIDYIVDGYADSVDDMVEWGMAIIEAPSIDIVRCKECKHGTWHEQAEMYICSANDQDLYEAEHFCSYGERREP